MIAVGVTAYKRDIIKSIEDIRRGGFYDLIISAEPDISASLIHGVLWSINKQRLGLLENALKCYRLLLDTQKPYAMIVENDVQMALGAYDIAVKKIRETERFGFISLYTPIRYEEFLPPNADGWIDFNIGWGNIAGQAILFPRNVLIEVLKDPRLEEMKAGKITGSVDSIAADYCQVNNLPTFYHVPSLCEHTGDVSTREKQQYRWFHKGLKYEPSLLHRR